MAKLKLDRLDLEILEELQNNCRITNTELAKRVNLSPTPCLERVKRLESSGYIKRFAAEVNAKRLGVSLVVFIEISLTRTSPDGFAAFKLAVADVPEIQECHLLSGNFDYLIKARVSDMEHYRVLLGETILSLPGVRESRSYVVMETIKESNKLNLRDLKRALST